MRPLRGLGRPVVGLIVLVVLLTAGLAWVSQLKFTSFLSDSINGRLEVVAATGAQDFAAAVDLGLSLDEVANGEAILDRARRHDPNIEAVYVIDLEGNVLHGAGTVPARADRATLGQLALARKGVTGPTWGTDSGGIIRSGSLIEGSFGQPVGAIVVEYPKAEMNAQTGSMADRLVVNGLVVALGLAVAGAVVLGVLSSRRVRLLALSASLLLVVGVAVFGVLILRDFNSELAPELSRRAALIGETISDDTERAVAVGIPIDGLVGVEEYFDAFLDGFAELDSLAVHDAQGSVLYAAGDRGGNTASLGTGGSIDYTFAIQSQSGEVGSVVVGVDSGWVQSRLDDLALDVAVILIVALVIAFELTRVLGRSIATSHGPGPPSDDPAAVSDGAADIRIVLFLFVVGEELNKSFLPLFIRGADNPISGLDPSVAISLPIAAYLMTIAIASPFAGSLTGRFGNRGLFAIGVLPAALSHLGMVYADNVVQILVLRALTGVGYALVTIAAMEFILDRASVDTRARGIGVFVAVVIGGTFAGTALGGILADNLGYDAVFRISAGLVALAGGLGLVVMKPKGVQQGDATGSFTMRDAALVLKQRSLLSLMAGVTVPMNVLMAAFLWFVVPLTLANVGSSASSIARTLMVYYLVILIGGPLVTKLGERRAANRRLVGIGTVMSGAVLLLPAFWVSATSVFVAVLVVGVGHTAVRGPQIALALDIADTELPEVGRGPVLAAMRSIERIGSLVGVLVVAVLVARFDLSVAAGAIGIAGALAGLAYLAAPRAIDREPVDA